MKNLIEKIKEKLKKIIKGKGKPFLIFILVVVVYFIGYFVGSAGFNPAAEGLAKDMYDFFDDIVNTIPDKETQEQLYLTILQARGYSDSEIVEKLKEKFPKIQTKEEK